MISTHSERLDFLNLFELFQGGRKIQSMKHFPKNVLKELASKLYQRYPIPAYFNTHPKARTKGKHGFLNVLH